MTYTNLPGDLKERAAWMTARLFNKWNTKYKGNSSTDDEDITLVVSYLMEVEDRGFQQGQTVMRNNILLYLHKYLINHLHRFYVNMTKCEAVYGSENSHCLFDAIRDMKTEKLYKYNI